MRPCPIIVRAVFAEARENIHPLQADRCLMTFTSTHTISTLFLKVHLQPSQYSKAVFGEKEERKLEILTNWQFWQLLPESEDIRKWKTLEYNKVQEFESMFKRLKSVNMKVN